MSIRRITDDLLFVGASDRRLALFENVYPIPQGVSYNAYLLRDGKNVLFDTVDRAVADTFMAATAEALEGEGLDYVIVQHMEPDHCAALGAVLARWQNAAVVCNKKTVTLLNQFFPGLDLTGRVRLVADGEELCTGRHTLTFVMAPMVHWPEVMMTYDKTDGTLFSADAFGGFGALSGNLFADEADIGAGYLEEMRRYYTNIVGKYGAQVQAVLKKAADLDIRRICPLHGYIWRGELGLVLEKYSLWSKYTPEERGVLIAYATVYGGTQAAAELLADYLAEAGVCRIRMFDVSAVHPSYVLAEAFRVSYAVFAAPTYNNGIFVSMETLLHDLAAHNWQGRTVALIENGSWAPASGKLMRELLMPLKNTTILEPTLTLRSALAPGQEEAVRGLAQQIAASVLDTAD